MIPDRFISQINTHLLGNMLEIDDYPLILAIIGKPGMGKTWQLRQHLKLLGIQVYSINSADLESERAGAPAKLLKQQYVDASVNISRKNPSALVIDDIDTTVGEWEQNTGTVNHQGILAFLMHIADSPYYIENIGKMNRVPVFFTGNNFELLYEPLRRPGRTRLFDWEPKKEEKVEIITSYLSKITNAKDIALELVNSFPDQSISFYTDFFATLKLEYLMRFANKATFKYILSDSRYKYELYQKYMDLYNHTDWKKIITERREKNGKNDN